MKVSEPIIILQFCDGWEIKANGKTYHWDHNDEDLGTTAIAVLLRDLGFKDIVEESY